MTKSSSPIIITGIMLALIVTIFVPTHVVMAIGTPKNAFDLSNILIGLVNQVFVPLIFSVSFIVFIWGIFRHFIAGAADTTEQEKGKHLIIYGLAGLAIMASVWGLVNILNNTFGLNSSRAPQYSTLPVQ